MLYFGFSRLLRIRQPVADVQMAAEGAPFSVDTHPATCPVLEMAYAKLSIYPSGTPRSCMPPLAVHKKAWSNDCPCTARGASNSIHTTVKEIIRLAIIASPDKD